MQERAAAVDRAVQQEGRCTRARCGTRSLGLVGAVCKYAVLVHGLCWRVLASLRSRELQQETCKVLARDSPKSGTCRPKPSNFPTLLPAMPSL